MCRLSSRTLTYNPNKIMSMNASEVIAMNDGEIVEIGKQLRTAYQLKKTLRYSGSRDMSVHGESVAEHIFALFFLAEYFLPLEDPDGELDKVRLYQIILFHDFGEIPNGDVPYHRKTKADEDREREDAKTVFGSLPPPFSSTGLERWEEYERRETAESRFAYALDKIETIFELLDPVSQTSLKRLKFTYKMHITKKLEATESFPVMRRFVDAISLYIKSQGVFWEEGS